MHWNYNKVRALSTFHTANINAKGASGGGAGRSQLVNPRLPYAVAAQPGGQQVAVALGDGAIAIYDLASKKLVRIPFPFLFSRWHGLARPRLHYCLHYRLLTLCPAAY